MMHTDALTEQVAIAYIAARLIECAKRSSLLPWVNEHSDDLNRWLSRIIAVATSAGLTVAWSGSVDAGGVLTITVPSASAWMQFVVNAVFSFASQEIIYKTSIKRSA